MMRAALLAGCAALPIVAQAQTAPQPALVAAQAAAQQFGVTAANAVVNAAAATRQATNMVAQAAALTKALAALGGTVTPPPPPPPPSGTVPLAGYVSPAALIDQASGVCQGSAYPARPAWAGTPQARDATAADNLAPRVELWRNGAKFTTLPGLGGNYNANEANQSTDAAYLTANGALGRRSYRALLPGDVIKVWPAVYHANQMNDPFFGGGVDTYPQYQAIGHAVGSISNPDPSVALLPVVGGLYANFVSANVTIQGQEVNGIRPVLYDGPGDSFGSNLDAAPVDITAGNGITWSNIDVVADPNYGGAKAGLYAYGTGNLTIANSRFMGWGPNANTNGSMGIMTGEGGPSGLWGTLTLTNDEVGYSGGTESSYAHNLYIGSGTDATFRVVIRGLWSHDSYGHELKVRAPFLDLEGSYLQGSGSDIAALDYSNGGTLVMRDNILYRTAPADYDATNGSEWVRYAYENPGNAQPSQAGYVYSADIENNTFVSGAKQFLTSGGSVPPMPLGFYYPNAAPPAGSVIADNAFVGFCPTGQPLNDYRGTYAGSFGVGEVSASYGLTGAPTSNTSPVGWPAYVHQAGTGARAAATIGALD